MSRKQYSDAVLWDAFWAARREGDEARQRLIGGAILETHKGFLIQYARGTAFPSWSKATVQDYQAELVLVALEKMHLYDRSKASFPTYIKRHLLEVKWKVHIASQLITVGVETARLRTAADGFISEFKLANGTDPSLVEVAAFLTEKFSKQKRPIGIAQASRLVDRPVFERPDAIAADGEGTDGWALIASALSVEDVVLDGISGEEIAGSIADALVECVNSDLERDVLRLRMMAPPRKVEDGVVVFPGPSSHSALASAHGVSPSMVKATEEDLVLRMAHSLKQ